MKISNEKKIVYVIVCLGCLTISFNVAAITAAVPVMSADLQLSNLLVAQIIPFYLVPYGLGALMYAPLTRFFSYKTVYVASMLLYGVFCYICGQSNDLQTILAGRIGMGLTASSAIPLGLMLIGEFFEKDVRGRLVGVFFSCAFVASIVGLLVAGTMDWPWIFHIPAILAISLALVIVLSSNKLLSAKHVGHINYLKALSNTSIAKVFCFIFVISFLYHAVHKWYGVYLSQVYGFDKLAISFFFILTVVGGMLGQLTGGYLSDKKGRLFTCILGVVGLSLSVMLLFGEYSHFVLGVVLLLISVFWTIGHNGISTVLTDFSDDHRPIIASLNSSVRFVSGGLGFFFSSFFVEKSFHITFLGIGVLMLVSAFFLKVVVLAKD